MLATRSLLHSRHLHKPITSCVHRTCYLVKCVSNVVVYKITRVKRIFLDKSIGPGRHPRDIIFGSRAATKTRLAGSSSHGVVRYWKFR